MNIPGLDVQLLSRACRVFMTLAYPAGAESMPQKKRLFWDLCGDTSLDELLPPAERVRGLSAIRQGPSGEPLVEFRLGCNHFPHLKLRVQRLASAGGLVWVFMVDTHDRGPTGNHDDAEAWRALQDRNRQLKESIETALEQEGLTTPNKLLRDELV